MKRHIDIYLAALSLLAAMSAVSCEKETPIPLAPAPAVTAPAEPSWTLAAGSLPAYDKDGGETAFTVTLATNIPAGELAVESDAWIGAAITDGSLSVTLQRNGTTELRTGTVTVKDTKGRVQSAVLRIDQDWLLENGPGMVPFRDKAFKKHMLSVADADKDGDISQDEAETVQVIEAAGKGIRDISGIEAFQNVWKINLVNNDIVDATAVKDHPYLHWLNLKGNKHLRTFDVRGCTSYFEVCDFEVTENLDYYLYYRTMGVTWPDDKNCEHSHHSRDPRLTQDWSREGECYQVSRHTKGPGKMAVVFSGIGWIDVDVNDGTFERIIHETIEELKKQPSWAENWDYFDVYVYIHMAEKRGQWMWWGEPLAQDSPEKDALRKSYNDHRKALWKEMEKAVSNEYCYKITVDNHTNIMFNSVVFNSQEFSHIVPINHYDCISEKESYVYVPINEAVTYFENDIGKLQWQDWKEFD